MYAILLYYETSPILFVLCVLINYLHLKHYKEDSHTPCAKCLSRHQYLLGRPTARNIGNPALAARSTFAFW